MSYDDLTDDELRELHATCRRFLHGEAEPEDLPADSMKRVRETFKALRAVHVAIKADMATQMATLRRATEEGSGAVSRTDVARLHSLVQLSHGGGALCMCQYVSRAAPAAPAGEA